MKRVQIIILVLLGWVLSACTPQQPSLQSSGEGINAMPALWVATNHESTVYLFGSVHILPPKVKWYGPRIERSFNAADELVLETLPSQENKEQYRTFSRKHGFLPKGKMISAYLNASEYAMYLEIVNAIKLNPYIAGRMKPWLFTLTVDSAFKKEMSRYGVDRLMYNASLKAGKKVTGLEMPSESLAYFASIPLNQDIRKLKEILNRKKVSSKGYITRAQMIMSWAMGDTERTARLFAQNTSSKMYRGIITKRNNSWYPKIRQYLHKPQTTMVVVGQAHLIGRGNIIDMLRRSGYRVQRVQ